MIEGSIFFALALTGLRYKIVKMIPEVSLQDMLYYTRVPQTLT